MSNGAEHRDERAWAADKRDFVADRRDRVAERRDEIADARDTIADERETRADEREARLDARERQTEERAEELGLPPQYSAAEERRRATERGEAAEERREAREARARSQDERDEAGGAREAAAKRRHADFPQTGLALAFAELARYLYEADAFEDVLTRIIETAVAAVSGCDMASITVRDDEDGSFRTVASTSYTALSADSAQYTSGEGPSLDAVDEAMVHAPSLPDDRWPTLGAKPAEAGAESIVSYRLAAEARGPGSVPEDSVAGVLNAYAGRPEAFGDEAREIGLILAAHASVGMRAVREREGFTQFSEQLHEALLSRDVIGQAKGILMERLRIPPEDAFDVLRRASQQLNVKLRDLAEKVAETGEFKVD